ncbi:MAG: hypothetical protein ACFFB3_20830 [Candidatus Hodarchaeota archaeon]
MVSENEWIAIASLMSSSVAAFMAGILIYDWNRTEKHQRLEWGIGMVTYSIGHFIVFMIYWFILSGNELIITAETLDFWDVKTWVWVYVNLGGAITMALIMKGLLPLFTKKSKYVYGIPALFASLYFVGTTAYAYILPNDSSFKFVNLGASMLDTHDYTQYDNMSWYLIELLFPVSLFIGILFLMHYRDSEMISSLLIAIHFLGYCLLLIIWPFEDFKLAFYAGRTVITTIMAIGFIDLIRKTPEPS